MNPPLKVGDVVGTREILAVRAPVQQGRALNRMYVWACRVCTHGGVASAYNIRNASTRRCAACGTSTDTIKRDIHRDVARRSARRRRRERGDELRKYDRGLKRRRRAELKAARA